MRSTPHQQAVEWLAAAAVDPRACKREWEHSASGTVLLPAGRFWDVLSVPEEIGLLALDALLRLPLPMPGPTLADFGAHRIGFFLPPDPESYWVGQDIRYSGKGAWIAVPSPRRTTGTPRWLIPPDGRGALHLPTALELALHQAMEMLSDLVNGEHARSGGNATPPGSGPGRGGLR
ncbi:hypothetical protein [Streptomyces albicerus]|uniref:hypothetical protein n=1 Tax=Streptomyces albicerus TaxID=2569859 RepID=UPI00124B405B|nr:hypothetical protein [Streptomyces albicerus]